MTCPDSRVWLAAFLLFLAGGLSVGASTAAPRIGAPVAEWDFDTISSPQSPVVLGSAIQTTRSYRANFGTNNSTVPVMLFDGYEGSSFWSFAGGQIWTGNGTVINLPYGSNPLGTNISLLLYGGSGLTSNGKSIVFKLDMTKCRRLEISYATRLSDGGFTTHEWAYWDDVDKIWRDIKDSQDNRSVTVPSVFSTIVLDQVGGAGFNNRPNARVRLTLSGATTANGANFLDNIRFNATVAP